MIRERSLSGRPFLSLQTLALVLVVTTIAHPQARSSATNGSALLDKLKKEPFPLTINQVADANLTEAIPILKQKFAETEVKKSSTAYLDDNLATKGALASALVRLGERNGPHWEFLETQAKLATDSDAPWPIARDAKGNFIPKQFSPEFLAWAEAHRVDPVDASWNQIGLQNRLWPLAATGDIRGLSILRKALSSPNYLVQSVGAKGLALLQDRDSIPSIIDACERTSVFMSADAADVIARSLVFFDDARAQIAAEKYIRNRSTVDSLRQTKKVHGPRGVFR